MNGEILGSSLVLRTKQVSARKQLYCLGQIELCCPFFDLLTRRHCLTAPFLADCREHVDGRAWWQGQHG